MPNAVIAGYSRSPFTISFKGDLKELRPEDVEIWDYKGQVD